MTNPTPSKPAILGAPSPELTEQQEAERKTWQYRAIKATCGTQSRLGAILVAALGRSERLQGRRIVGRASITSDGYVMVDFVDSHGRYHFKAFICSVEDLTRNLRGLSDMLKLSDAERIEMFDEVRKWIDVDYRAHPGAGGAI